nr:MAG TPA: minor tail protein [Bacteriophage sp.]
MDLSDKIQELQQLLSELEDKTAAIEEFAYDSFKIDGKTIPAGTSFRIHSDLLSDINMPNGKTISLSGETLRKISQTYGKLISNYNSEDSATAQAQILTGVQNALQGFYAKSIKNIELAKKNNPKNDIISKNLVKEFKNNMGKILKQATIGGFSDGKLLTSELGEALYNSGIKDKYAEFFSPNISFVKDKYSLIDPDWAKDNPKVNIYQQAEEDRHKKEEENWDIRSKRSSILYGNKENREQGLIPYVDSDEMKEHIKSLLEKGNTKSAIDTLKETYRSIMAVAGQEFEDYSKSVKATNEGSLSFSDRAKYDGNNYEEYEGQEEDLKNLVFENENPTEHLNGIKGELAQRTSSLFQKLRLTMGERATEVIDTMEKDIMSYISTDNSPDNKSIETNISESFNRFASMITQPKTIQRAVKKYANKTGITQQEALSMALSNGDIDTDLFNTSTFALQTEMGNVFYNSLQAQIAKKIPNFKDYADWKGNGGLPSSKYTPISDKKGNNLIHKATNEQIVNAIQDVFSIFDDQEVQEIAKQFKQFSNDTLSVDQFIQGVRTQLDPNAQYSTNKKPKNSTTPLVPYNKKEIKDMNIKSIHQSKRLGGDILGAYGVSSLEEGIEAMNLRLSQRETELNEINKQVSIIQEKYGLTKNGNVKWSSKRGILNDKTINADRSLYTSLKRRIKTIGNEQLKINEDLEWANNELSSRQMPIVDNTIGPLPYKDGIKIKTFKKNNTNDNNVVSTIEDENKEIAEGTDAIQKHTAVIQEEAVAEQNKIGISETLSKILQEERKAFGDVSSVEQSTNAVEENTAAIKENSEAKRENAETSGIKLEKLNISKSDNFENDHTYYDESGNRVMSATQLRDILLGKSNPTLAKDIQHVKEVASTLGEGQALTADMVGAKEGDFNFLKNIIGSGLKGDIFHEIVDGIYKYNAGHQDDMISSLEELKGRDDEAYERLTKSFNKTKSELAKYGFEEDYLTTHSDIAAYMEAIQKMGLKPTGFSEKALGFTLSGSQGAFKVAVTPDQLYSGELGPVLMDNKTGSVKGFESFQLMAQLLGLKANSDLSELEGLDLDKTELTINDVKNGFSQILKYSELTKEQFYDLLVRAQKILDGTASPLDKEEVAKYSTQQKTGIITGGTKQEYVNPVEQNALISQAVKNQKAVNQVTEQIDLLTKKANDPSRLKTETQSYLEQIKLLQQKLALLEKTQFVLNQEGNLVKLVNGEEVKNVSLNEEQQTQLKEQLALLENQHKTVMAKNAGYTNKNQRGFFGAIFGQIKQTFEYLTRTSIVYGVIGKIQSTFSTLIQTVQSLDKAMVDLQIATNTTRSELQEATKDYNSIATETGRTTQEVMTAANDWLRAGYKTKEANELIRDSMKLSTLGMIDSAKATEYLISTMKGWKLQAEEVSGVVDDLTALDMEFATSAGDIAQAMAKANVSASLAGVDRKTYESMLTAVMDVGQQGADVVGTA